MPHPRRQLCDWAFQSTKKLSPRAIRATNDESPPDIKSPPTLFDQITNAHIFKATAVLDAALQDFHRDGVTGLSSAGLQHKVGWNDNDGGELAEIKREQYVLVEEGLILRKCQCITRSMTGARQKENPPRGNNNAHRTTPGEQCDTNTHRPDR